MRVYLIHAVASAFAFSVFATLSSIYRIRDVGLGPLELVLVGTVLEATVLLAELPTGVVADTVSRRLSLLIGSLLIAAGFLLEGLVPVLAAVMAAQVIWGLGAAFESGAVEAWLSDEVGEAPASLAFLRGAQARQIGLFAGIPLAAWLGSRSLGLPLAMGGVGFLVLAAFLAVTMQENGFEGASGRQRNPVRALLQTVGRAATFGRSRPLIASILAVAVFVGASSETFDRLWEARLLAGVGLPEGVEAPLFFAALAAVTAAVSIVAAEYARRALRDGPQGGASRGTLVAWLTGAMVVQAVTVAAFGLAGRLDLALGMYLAARVAGGLHVPLYRAWLNRELEPTTRATVFSAAGVANAGGQVLGGPLLGLVAAVAGMPAAFVAAALVLGPAVVLLSRTLGIERARRV